MRNANPVLFEEKIRENQRQDPKFSFLNSADPYNAYYRDRMERLERGDIAEAEVAAAAAKEGEVDAGRTEAVTKQGMPGRPPPPSEFILDLPNINALDLDIMKLTALFTARRGRSFLAALSVREGRNFQFEFLRPTHSLFGYFNLLVEQYKQVINPRKDLLNSVAEHAEPKGKWALLDKVREYAEWERTKKEREKKREDEKELERRAFAEIDWHDYAIVQTIEFTQADASAELPAPMSIAEVESMTLAQKQMAAMIMEDAGEDVEALRVKQAAADAEASKAARVDVDMDDEDAEARERRRRDEEERERELERARAVQATSLDAGGPMKIRTDYVPKIGAKAGKSAMTTCTVCGQQIPVDEIDEHMRIELLDPRWKSQRDVLEARRAQASELQGGANIVTSLKNLARARVDIFGDEQDEDKRRKEEEEEREKRREREKVVWDGHTATKAGTMDRFQSNVNFDEQIKAIHRAKGVGAVDESAIGPGIGPAMVPPPITSLPPPPASLPAPPTSLPGATISSGPQPSAMPSGYPGQTPVSLPPLHYQGLNAPQPFGYQPPPPGMGMPMMHPSRMAALGGPPGPSLPVAGVVRSADEMTGAEDDPVTLAKRQRVEKLPGGHLYPEQNWIDMHPHPIHLQVQLPTDTVKPEWKLDGKIVDIADLHITTLVSTLRDRITKQLDSTVPPGRMRLAYAGKELRNASTLASYNLDHGDLISLTIREPKKK
ncbi:hypothetical protein SISNIDRAFT_447772 [Sistotremastrum niveocremeum HHB9708]|uniref:Uncharacterized protein n=1 Tax=Sistotremastrum niveocremeum HHB9708 TaxID=1314777 RepID=A0A165AG58_9AGAM|nr:hypothetical protein SISNIDRAFT_447772 [Sistotremastrum niveocremeum HHB9708]